MDEREQLGIGIKSNEGEILRFAVVKNDRDTRFACIQNGRTIYLNIPDDLDFRAMQELRFEVDVRSIKLSLDGIRVPIDNSAITRVADRPLLSSRSEASFSAFRLTQGFEELFENGGLEERGWAIRGSTKGFTVADKCLLVSEDEPESDGIVQKCSARRF